MEQTQQCSGSPLPTNNDTMKSRKVAVFDCDGTLIGQRPYYLNDEALFSYMAPTKVKLTIFPNRNMHSSKNSAAKKKRLLMTSIINICPHAEWHDTRRGSPNRYPYL